MNIVEVVVLVLATWRLTSLLVTEDGPFEVFARIRKILGVRYDEWSTPYGTNWLAKGLVCTWCVSVWMGFLWAIAYMLFGKYATWVAFPFALSAGAIVVQAVVDRG